MSNRESQQPLERRYRRLLAAYPAEYRSEHGEEMLGVLLAAATPGEARVGPARTLDLIWGGLRIRLRSRGALGDADGWRAALAVVSVTLPVLLLASVCWSYLADAVVPTFLNVFALKGVAFALVILGQILIVPLALLGLRRVAAAVAVAQAVAGALRVMATPLLASPLRGGTLIVEGVTLAALSLAEAVALLASPGPRAGLALIRRRGWLVLMSASLPAAVLAPTFAALRTWPIFRPASLTATAITGVRTAAFGALVLLLLGAWLSSAAGKRLAVLFCVIGYPYALMSVAFGTGPFWGPQVGVAMSVPVLLVGCALMLVIRRFSRPGPDGPWQPSPRHDGPASGAAA